MNPSLTADAGGAEAPSSQVLPQIEKAAESAAIDGMADAMGHLNSKLIAFLDRYFTKLSENMSERHSETPDKSDMIERVKSQLMKRLDPNYDV